MGIQSDLHTLVGRPHCFQRKAAPGTGSFADWLAQARMLLARSDRTVTRIAEETGFCDASHLIRVFREAEGITPDIWRQQSQPAMEGEPAAPAH